MAVDPGDPDLPADVYGSAWWPRRWFRINFTEGTSAIEFASFVEDALSEIENYHLDEVDVG